MAGKELYRIAVWDKQGKNEFLILLFCSNLSESKARCLSETIFPRVPIARIIVSKDEEKHAKEFNRAINALKRENNWEENPCLALWLLEEDEKIFCHCWSCGRLGSD